VLEWLPLYILYLYFPANFLCFFIFFLKGGDGAERVSCLHFVAFCMHALKRISFVSLAVKDAGRFKAAACSSLQVDCLPVCLRVVSSS
jgi:hypothetical protein